MALSAKQQKDIVLEYYARFHHPKFLEWDPLVVVREFIATDDMEWIALMSAVFAFGGVKQVIASVRKALKGLELNPALPGYRAFVSQFSSDESEVEFAGRLHSQLQGFRHRIYVEKDLVVLLLLYRR